MGVISDLVRMKGEKDTAQKIGALEAMRTVLGSPNISEEGRQWAQQGIIDLATNTFGEGGKGKGAKSDKGGVGGFFHSLMGGLQKMNPYQASPGVKSGIAEEMQGTARNPRPQRLFLTPEEQTQLQEKQKVAAEQIEFQEKQRQAAEVRKQKLIDDQEFHERRMKEGQQIGLTGTQLAEYSDPNKAHLSSNTSWRPVISTHKVDPDNPEAGPQTRYDWPDGTTTYTPEAAPPTSKTTSDMGAQEKSLLWANQHINDADPNIQKTARQVLENFKLNEQSKQIGITIRQENAATNNAPSQAGVTSYWADYVSRGGQISYGLLRQLGKKQVADIMAEVPKIAAMRGQSVGDVIASQSDIAANKAALNRMETQFAQTSAFEKTARANLDRAIDAAGKIADKHSPLVNRPWRLVEREVLGKPEYAAFHAARVVAFTEVSKVLNNPMGAGAVSDTARKEAEGALSENATLGQLQAAADILRQDMATRIDSMQQTIEATKRKIAASPGATNTPQIKIISVK
jgi:hypothetical protein